MTTFLHKHLYIFQQNSQSEKNHLNEHVYFFQFFRRIIRKILWKIFWKFFEKSFEKSLKNLWKIFENRLKIDWKSFENPLKSFENPLKFFEILWKSHENPLKILWKSFENPLKILWKNWKLRWVYFCFFLWLKKLSNSNSLNIMYSFTAKARPFVCERQANTHQQRQKKERDAVHLRKRSRENVTDGAWVSFQENESYRPMRAYMIHQPLSKGSGKRENETLLETLPCPSLDQATVVTPDLS